MNPPFTTINQFQLEFKKGLEKLALLDDLGPFILACANATSDSILFSNLHAILQESYERLYKRYQDQLLRGATVDAVDEDLLVFLKLHTIGFDAIRQSEIRNENDWIVQFNHLRSFRPRRITNTAFQGVQADYQKNAFNFNKPFLVRECFWAGELLGRQVDLFYNKYPFAQLHGLLVLDKSECFSQYLNEENHQYIFNLGQALDDTFNGIGFGYNSYGAYASVNHLHFQMFVDPSGLPVTKQQWQHNGGEKKYPLNVSVFETAEESWEFINDCHQNNQPYNLLYQSDKVYVFPRRPQGVVDVPEWSSGFTWYELSGAMISFNYDDYQSLTSGQIEKYLSDHNVYDN